MEIEDEPNQLVKIYISQATQMKYNSKQTLEVDYRHIKEWSAS
jgi:hypothetical protein